jgi:hypothetical protein
MWSFVLKKSKSTNIRANASRSPQLISNQELPNITNQQNELTHTKTWCMRKFITSLPQASRSFSGKEIFRNHDNELACSVFVPSVPQQSQLPWRQSASRDTVKTLGRKLKSTSLLGIYMIDRNTGAMGCLTWLSAPPRTFTPLDTLLDLR